MIVGRWKKDAKEFAVGVNYVENRGYSSSIPKPVVEILGNPDSIKYVVMMIRVFNSFLEAEKVKSKRHG